jgi:hypothetical protein
LARALPDLKRIVPAGDFRRGCELACDLSFVAEDTKLEDGPELVKTNQLSVYLTDPEHFGSSLLLATGSNAHLQQLRTLAEDQGLSLTDRGLHHGDKSIAAKTEAGIYKTLGLQYIEPELREGRNEIALARKHLIPRLAELEDLRGILHAHTDQSDGGNSLEEMAEATRKRGYEYFGVADHSQSARYAGGLSVEQVRQQHAEIDHLNGLPHGVSIVRKSKTCSCGRGQVGAGRAGSNRPKQPLPPMAIASNGGPSPSRFRRDVSCSSRSMNFESFSGPKKQALAGDLFAEHWELGNIKGALASPDMN